MNIEKRGMTVNFPWERFAGLRRPGHTVVTAKTEEWLAERAAFAEKWEALQDEGLREGFLGYEPCYECAGTVEPTTNVEDRVWVADEEAAK